MFIVERLIVFFPYGVKFFILDLLRQFLQLLLYLLELRVDDCISELELDLDFVPLLADPALATVSPVQPVVDVVVAQVAREDQVLQEALHRVGHHLVVVGLEDDVEGSLEVVVVR